LLTPAQRQFIARAQHQREKMKIVAQIRAAHWIAAKYAPKPPRKKMPRGGR
jgi:hypothetical protein